MDEVKEDLQKPLLQEDVFEETGEPTPNSKKVDLALWDIKSRKEVTTKEEKEKSAKDTGKWETTEAPPKGIVYTLGYIMPCLWSGGIWIKL
jgi:hypothetical protein